MRTSSIISAAIAIFSVFAAASPVASPPALVVRDDSDGAGIISALTSGSDKLDACHAKWKETCKNSCTTTDISNWQKEAAVIVTEIKVNVDIAIAAAPAGFVFLDASVCISLLVKIIVNINIVLTFLLGQCGLLVGLLTFILSLVLSILVDLQIAIKALIQVLITVCLNLVVSLSVQVGLGLGGATCYCCSLFGI